MSDNSIENRLAKITSQKRSALRIYSTLTTLLMISTLSLPFLFDALTAQQRADSYSTFYLLLISSFACMNIALFNALQTIRTIKTSDPYKWTPNTGKLPKHTTIVATQRKNNELAFNTNPSSLSWSPKAENAIKRYICMSRIDDVLRKDR